MRVKSVTERYRAVNEGTMSKKEFVRQMRQQYPMHVTQFNGFDDSVQILRNRGLLFETKTEVVEEAKVYDDRPALTYSLDALDRGIRVELATMGVEPGQQSIKGDDLKKATKKAKDNLEKNPTHYLDLMSGESNKVDKQDKMKETKRGAKDTDVMNGLKKATLKEGYTEEQIEAAVQRIKERKAGEHEDGTPKSNDEMGDDEREDFYNNLDSVEEEKSEEEKEIQGFKDKALVDAGVSLTGTGASTHEIVFDHRGTTQTIAFRDSEEAAEEAKTKLDNTGYFGDKNLRVVPAGTDSVDEKDGYNTDPNLQMHIDDEEWERENGRGPKKDVVKEAGKTALIQTMNNAISAIKGKFGDMPGIAGIIRDFLKTHINDLANGADPLDEFENYVNANYDSLSETEVSEEYKAAYDSLVEAIKELNTDGDEISAAADAMEFIGQHYGIPFEFESIMPSRSDLEEKKGKDQYVDEAAKETKFDPDEIKSVSFPNGLEVTIGEPHPEEEGVVNFIRKGQNGYEIGFLDGAEGGSYAVDFNGEFLDEDDFIEEAKGKDHDGDGDIDGDDYKAAKDKAIKKAMGKDEQIKEAVKSIIKKVLTENKLNEAATGNLSKFSDDYADFAGMTQIINQLENLVTEVEGFYAKTGDKLQKIFDSIGNVTNEEGLKVGGFIAPSIESAFKKDIQPVVKRGFMNSVQIPTIKQITQSDIDLHNSGERSLGEEEVEEKHTMFTPVNELNFNKKEIINNVSFPNGVTFEVGQYSNEYGMTVTSIEPVPEDEREEDEVVYVAMQDGDDGISVPFNANGEEVEI